ncbi:hypothetical protein [Massilicoli timonensis]|uniref:hypothetical protein n=1 Tax=Massilicoli timonensis TaxID=2015901 RepID=UPI0011AF3E4F|nr:hypothetical protein [Massilicoli timonensis]
MSNWKSIKNFSRDIIEEVRERNRQRFNDAQIEIQIEDIKKIVYVLKELDIENDKIIRIL